MPVVIPAHLLAISAVPIFTIEGGAGGTQLHTAARLFRQCLRTAAPAIAIQQVDIRSRLCFDQRSFLDTGSVVRTGSLGSHLGGCRIIGLGLAAVICGAIARARQKPLSPSAHY